MSSKSIGLLAVAAIVVVVGAGISLSVAETAHAPKPAASAPTTPAATPTLTVAPAHGAPAEEVPAAAAFPAGPAGKAEMPETSFDAGVVERGSEVSHAFLIKNVGEHPLTVDARPG
jgi:hypothetical protein